MFFKGQIQNNGQNNEINNGQFNGQLWNPPHVKMLIMGSLCVSLSVTCQHGVSISNIFESPTHHCLTQGGPGPGFPDWGIGSQFDPQSQYEKNWPPKKWKSEIKSADYGQSHVISVQAHGFQSHAHCVMTCPPPALYPTHVVPHHCLACHNLFSFTLHSTCVAPHVLLMSPISDLFGMCRPHAPHCWLNCLMGASCPSCI